MDTLISLGLVLALFGLSVLTGLGASYMERRAEAKRRARDADEWYQAQRRMAERRTQHEPVDGMVIRHLRGPR